MGSTATASTHGLLTTIAAPDGPENSASAWKNPYLLGTTAIAAIAVLSMTLSILLVCRKMHHFHHCSLFLVEMAVGSLTTEAIVHLLPSLIITEKLQHPYGMPPYFPRLAAITAGVCLLHALDTASVVFFGRRQSTSHAMEWREEVRNSSCNRKHGAIDSAATVTPDEGELDSPGVDSEGGNSEGPAGPGNEDRAEEVGRVSLTLDSDGEWSGLSVQFDEDVEEPSPAGHHDMTVGEVLAHPKLCLQPGPYRLCSILSAGSILHSFADGVAIGAAFVKGWEAGLHLSVSVCMHELAHKVADFAVLTASGFSKRTMVTLNVCYWTSAFAGLFLSVPLSQRSDTLRAWIMTIATAVFVYISLVTMSSMVRKNYLRKHIPALVIGNLGMTTGYLVIMLASLLEFYI